MPRIVVALAVLVLLSVPAGSGPPPEPVRITVVATCDVHGALSRKPRPWSGGESVGGMDVLSGYLDIIRDQNPGGVVAVDAGDLMQGTLVSGRFKGRAMTRALRLMGFSAVALGNHEFDWGLSVLRRRGRSVRFLGANVTYRDGRTPRAFRPYRLVERKGIRIGIIGAAHPDTPAITSPRHVADLEFGDPAAAIGETLDAVHAAGASLVIVVAHVGGKGADHGRLGDLARSLDPSRVHVVVGGHTHRRVADVVNGIPVLQAWSGGTAFGRVELDVDPVSMTVAASYPSVRTTWAGAEGDPAFYEGRPVVPGRRASRLVNRWEKRVAKARARVVGVTAGPLTRDYRRESSMGDFVADVMRAGPPEADFALVNSGGLRADLPEGEVTFGEVYEVMPFDNLLVQVHLDGKQVREVLEAGVTGEHGVIQVSGLSFAFDYDLPVGERIVGDVLDKRTAAPLDPERSYVVAVPDFLADGGDDMELLTLAPQDRDGPLLRDLLVSWLKKHRPLAPPVVSEERRMTITGSAP